MLVGMAELYQIQGKILKRRFNGYNILAILILLTPPSSRRVAWYDSDTSL
jgi:hypothetical protein